MNKTLLTLAYLAIAANSTATLANSTTVFSPSTATAAQKLSYAFAYEMIKQTPELDISAFIAGAQASFAQSDLPFSQEELAKASQEVSQASLLKLAEEADKNEKLGQSYLADNLKKSGVQVTASGLQYSIQKKGTGKQPKSTDTVEVHYEGRLINGDIFDSSFDRGETIEFPLDKVIQGWTEGLQLMKEGAEYTFFIPAKLAYGAQEMGSIPPNSTLIFKVQLISVK